jgi:hypothetical protein
MERIRVNLRLMAKLQAGDRVCTQYVFFTIIKSDIWSKLRRSFFGSNRTSDFARIINLYNSAMDNECTILHKLCMESIVGLAALRETYVDDVTMTCRVDTLVSRIQLWDESIKGSVGREIAIS